MNTKFNYMVANPPYSAGLHVDFVNMGVDVCDTVICVHPSGPFVNRKPNRVQNRVKKLLGIMHDFKTKVHLFDGNAVFNAGFLTPLSITVIDTKTPNNGDIDVTGYYTNKVKLSRLNMFGDWVIPYYSKIEINNLAHYKLSGAIASDVWYVTIADVRGHPPEPGKRFNSDFFTMVPEGYEPTKEMPNRGQNFAFKTREEADNFISYLKTDFARFWLALFKMNVHLDSGELNAIPWLDFTKSWTDDELFKKFEMEDIRPRVKEIIEDYYGGIRHKTVKTKETREFTDKIERDRQKKTAEFFTPIELVNQMLDETDIDDKDSVSTFFEPSCGDGNILEGIVNRMQQAGVDNATIASRIYACEYMSDNRDAAIRRLVRLLGEDNQAVIESHIAYCNTLDQNDTTDGRRFPDWLKRKKDLDWFF